MSEDGLLSECTGYSQSKMYFDLEQRMKYKDGSDMLNTSETHSIHLLPTRAPLRNVALRI